MLLSLHIYGIRVYRYGQLIYGLRNSEEIEHGFSPLVIVDGREPIDAEIPEEFEKMFCIILILIFGTGSVLRSLNMSMNELCHFH